MSRERAREGAERFLQDPEVLRADLLPPAVRDRRGHEHGRGAPEERGQRVATRLRVRLPAQAGERPLDLADRHVLAALEDPRALVEALDAAPGGDLPGNDGEEARAERERHAAGQRRQR